MNSFIPVTQNGLDTLKADLAELKDLKRPALVERLSLARSMGDLAENSDYISAKEELEFMDGTIDELEEMIKNAKVTSPKAGDKIDFGHHVTVKIDSTTTKFQIVGDPEANPSQKKISHTSPLGMALMGKKVGDKVEVTAPVGKVLYTILSIE